MVPTQSRYVLKPFKGLAGLILLWSSYQVWFGLIADLPRESALSWVAATALGWLGIRWILGFLELGSDIEKPAAA